MGQSLQEIIQNMLNNVLNIINTPGTQWYLPTWLVNNNYDPYGADKAISWVVQLTDPNVVAQAANICPTIDITSSPCPGTDTFIGAPNNNPSLQLGLPNVNGSLQVTGASNAYMNSMTANSSNPYLIYATGTISQLPAPLPQSVVLKGNFIFNQWCCCSADGSTCDTAPSMQTGTGTFTATMMGQPTFGINFEITNLAQNVLDIQVTGMTFTPPYQPGTQTPNMSISIQITSIPEGANQQSYNNLAETAFNSTSALQNIAAQINNVLNDPGQLSFFSQVLTQVIDGYLQSNNLYPFGPLTMAVF